MPLPQTSTIENQPQMNMKEKREKPVSGFPNEMLPSPHATHSPEQKSKGKHLKFIWDFFD